MAYWEEWGSAGDKASTIIKAAQNRRHVKIIQLSRVNHQERWTHPKERPSYAIVTICHTLFPHISPNTSSFKCPGSPKGRALKALQFDHVAALATSLPHLPQAFKQCYGYKIWSEKRFGQRRDAIRTQICIPVNPMYGV